MKKYLLALAFMLSHIIATATVASIADVKHLGRADGLSSQRVFTILEDNDGVLWFSTRSGVDRYNGRTIKNYDLKGDFFYGDLAGRVIMLAKDSDRSIIAYDNIGRIYKYSPVFDRFDTAFTLSDDIPGFIRLNKYLKGKNNTEYFGLTQGLFARSGGEKSSAIIPGIDVNDIIEIDNSLFIATTSGLVKREANGKTTRFSPLEGNNIQTLFYFEQRKMLFAGTFNDGLWVIDLPHASHSLSRREFADKTRY